jgi:alpha-ketoglutarate-dependent taurine dioxygenase
MTSRVDTTPDLAVRPSPWMVERLTGTIGAVVTEVDLERAQDRETLSRLLHEYLVLIFPRQTLSKAGQVRVARLLGTPTPAHPVVPGEPDFPEILPLDGAKGGRNARWHTDITFVLRPAAASVLVADVVPSWGGDTLWSDARSGYERLAAPLRAALDELRAVHRITPLAYWGEPADSALNRIDAKALAAEATSVVPVVHPMVRVHPVTDRRSLFVNPGFTSHIVGLSRIESEHLLRLCYEHLAQPELTFRHRWQAGDVVIWDNQATLHYAADDYGHSERRLRRVTVAGPIPIGPDGKTSEEATDPLIAIR